MPLACACHPLEHCVIQSGAFITILLSTDTQLVQIMADLLILCTPFALIHSVGGVGAVLGTGARAPVLRLSFVCAGPVCRLWVFFPELKQKDPKPNLGIRPKHAL